LLAFLVGIALAVGFSAIFGPLGRRAAPFPRAPISPFGQLELDRRELPRSGPVPIALALAEPSANADPLPAHVFSTSDDRMIETKARLDEARSVATVEIDSGWLQPGTYLVQLKTTERSVLPLRRYMVVVR
jgi:hypothetical protein